MTIQTGSTTREILSDIRDISLEAPPAYIQIYQTMALVAALGNIEHRLMEISTYLASIEGQLFKR